MGISLRILSIAVPHSPVHNNHESASKELHANSGPSNKWHQIDHSRVSHQLKCVFNILNWIAFFSLMLLFVRLCSSFKNAFMCCSTPRFRGWKYSVSRCSSSNVSAKTHVTYTYCVTYCLPWLLVLRLGIFWLSSLEKLAFFTFLGFLNFYRFFYKKEEDHCRNS